MPKVSIIIPTYNNAHYLPDAVDSAMAQTYTDYEIIIIDDGSTDDTKQVVVPYLEKVGSRLKYIYQKNKGLAAARNTAINHAAGEYIALLDADDKWCKDRLEETVQAIERDEKIGVVHANIMRFSDGEGNLGVPDRSMEKLSGSILKEIFLRKTNIACPTVLFRKKCCDEVGGFDENLARLGCEDRELWLRIAEKYEFFYIDKVLARYRINPASMSRNKEKMMKARLYVVDKVCAKKKYGNLKREALGRIYKDLGDEYLGERSFKDAKRAYGQALRYQPSNPWAWMNLMKSIIGWNVKR